jgi:predicted ATPase with chaperone activity
MHSQSIAQTMSEEQSKALQEPVLADAELKEQLKAVQSDVAANPDAPEEKILELADEELQDVAGGATAAERVEAIGNIG